MGLIESLKAEAEEKEKAVELSEDEDGGEVECDETDAAKDDNLENSAEKLDDSPAETDSCEAPNCVPKCTVKRNRDGDAEEVLAKRARTGGETEDEGNDSPSSPLHLPSEQD